MKDIGLILGIRPDVIRASKIIKLLHENSDIDQQSNNSSVGNIAELINVGRTQMAGGNKFSMSGHVSCAHGNNLQPKQGKGIAYRDENGNLKTFAEVLSSFRKAYLR